MNITVNADRREVPDATTMASLLEQMDLHPKRVAVERNRKLVPRADYDRTALAEGDQIEIVTLVGGG
jgi:thiamine biosynthesis protein ThiS